MNKPISVIENATPHLIDGLLSMNTDNRSIRKGVVDMYADEIRAGRWCLTNQGVGVSNEGVLIDGQHRLLAIKKCGYPPLPILIVYGLTREARMAVDQHAKRSARDLLQFAFNCKVARSAPAIARLIDRDHRGWESGACPIGRIMEIVQDYMVEIEVVVGGPNFESYFSAPILTAAVKAARLYPDKHDEIVKFLDRVRIGEMLSRDEPAYCLAKLISTQRISGAADQKEFMHKTIRAISADLLGEKMKRLHS